MKYLIGIAVIVLIGLICFVPTHLESHTWQDGEFMHPGPRDSIEGYGQKLGFVYGRVTAIAHYEYPMATGLHWAYVNNYSGGLPDWPDKIPALRFYVDFYSKIEGPLSPHFDNDKEWHKEGELDSYWSNEPDALPGYWWVDAVHLEFNLKKEEWRKYTLTAEST